MKMSQHPGAGSRAAFQRRCQQFKTALRRPAAGQVPGQIRLKDRQLRSHGLILKQMPPALMKQGYRIRYLASGGEGSGNRRQNAGVL